MARHEHLPIYKAALDMTVHFDDDSMWVDLDDGRRMAVPLAWFPACFLPPLNSARSSS